MVFRGIPFAQPPVGALRFVAPQRPPSWEGVGDATEFGPAPPQSGPLRASVAGRIGKITEQDTATALRILSPGADGGLGSCHGLDVPLLFGTFSTPFGRVLLAGQEPSVEALTLAGEIRRAWTAFATHGDPGWPAYQTGQRLTRLLDVRLSTASYPEEASRQIWKGHHPDPFDVLLPDTRYLISLAGFRARSMSCE